MIKTMSRRWTIVDTVRPWTTNAERTWHYHKRAKIVKETRERWYILTKQAQIPRLNRISIAVTPLAVNKRWRPDVGACYPTVKAAIDGIVDAGVIIDDNPQHLDSIIFFTVDIVGRDGLRLMITELS